MVLWLAGGCVGCLEVLVPLGLPDFLLGGSMAAGGASSDPWLTGTPPNSLRAALTSGAGGTAESSA